MNKFRRIVVLNKLVGLFACLLLFLFSPTYANTTNSGQIIPFERLENGQYTINVYINDVGPLTFMIDTAASRTSIFEKTRIRLGLETSGSQKLINGITASGYRPTGSVRQLSFGRYKFSDHQIVILQDWDAGQRQGLDGILGMDVMDNLIFRFSHEMATVKINKKRKIAKSQYSRWKKIKLRENPYPVEKFGLMFTYTKRGDLFIPTLLDTGANFSALNWMSVEGTSIARERRRLREEWVVQGSIGEFKPRLRVRMEEANIGGLKLKQHEFLVMDFDSFPVNNHGAYPLVIAGIDLLQDRDFILDFTKDYLYIAPKSRKLRIGLRPSRIKRTVDE